MHPFFATFCLSASMMLARVFTPLASVDRDLWSLANRCVSVTWFVSIALRAWNGCVSLGLERPADAMGLELESLWRPREAYGLDPLAHEFGEQGCLPHDIALFPLLQISFYASELCWMWFQPRKALRKDDAILAAHHIVTASLILYWGIFHQMYWIAALVASLYDISDVFIDSAKYLKRKNNGKATWLIHALFVLFILTWFAIRVYYIPIQLLPQLWWHPLGTEMPLAYVAFSLLLLLQFAQAYWTFLLVRAVKRVFSGGTGELKDDREE